MPTITVKTFQGLESVYLIRSRLLLCHFGRACTQDLHTRIKMSSTADRHIDREKVTRFALATQLLESYIQPVSNL